MCSSDLNRFVAVQNSVKPGRINAATEAEKKAYQELQESADHFKRAVEKYPIIKEIKENQKAPTIDEDAVVEKQIELGKKEQEIKNANRRLIELEAILKQKGGRKTRRDKGKHKAIHSKSKTAKRRHLKHRKTKKKRN
mgnify:CR=1 FL=1